MKVKATIEMVLDGQQSLSAAAAAIDGWFISAANGWSYQLGSFTKKVVRLEEIAEAEPSKAELSR